MTPQEYRNYIRQSLLNAASNTIQNLVNVRRIEFNAGNQIMGEFTRVVDSITTQLVNASITMDYNQNPIQTKQFTAQDFESAANNALNHLINQHMSMMNNSTQVVNSMMQPTMGNSMNSNPYVPMMPQMGQPMMQMGSPMYQQPVMQQPMYPPQQFAQMPQNQFNQINNAQMSQINTTGEQVGSLYGNRSRKVSGANMPDQSVATPISVYNPNRGADQVEVRSAPGSRVEVPEDRSWVSKSVKDTLSKINDYNSTSNPVQKPVTVPHQVNDLTNKAFTNYSLKAVLKESNCIQSAYAIWKLKHENNLFNNVEDGDPMEVITEVNNTNLYTDFKEDLSELIGVKEDNDVEIFQPLYLFNDSPLVINDNVIVFNDIYMHGTYSSEEMAINQFTNLMVDAPFYNNKISGYLAGLMYDQITQVDVPLEKTREYKEVFDNMRLISSDREDVKHDVFHLIVKGLQRMKKGSPDLRDFVNNKFIEGFNRQAHTLLSTVSPRNGDQRNMEIEDVVEAYRLRIKDPSFIDGLDDILALHDFDNRLNKCILAGFNNIVSVNGDPNVTPYLDLNDKEDLISILSREDSGIWIYGKPSNRDIAACFNSDGKLHPEIEKKLAERTYFRKTNTIYVTSEKWHYRTLVNLLQNLTKNTDSFTVCMDGEIMQLGLTESNKIGILAEVGVESLYTEQIKLK